MWLGTPSLPAQDPFAPAAGAPAAKPAAAPAAPAKTPKKLEDLPPLAENERNPVVLAIRESNPKTPDELMFAVQTLIDIGRTDEAKTYLKKLLESTPSQDALVTLHEKYGPASFLQLSRDHRLQPEGGQVGRAVLDATFQFSRDPARLRTLVQQLCDASAMVRGAALHRLRSLAGAAVPPLLEALADAKRSADHPRLRAALVALGQPVVPPLLGAVDCPDIPLRLHVITALGELRTPRAVPLLVGPSLARELPDQVRQAAQQAVTTIVGEMPTRPDAVQYLYHQAQGFFNGDLPGRPDHEDKIELWQWDAAQKTVVPRRWAVADAGLMMAARLARDAYQLAPENGDCRRLFLVTSLEFAQREAGLDQPLPRGDGTAFTAAAKLGVDAAEDTLVYALDHQHLSAALSLVEILAELGDTGLLESPSGQPRVLVRALQHGDRRLRFAAAHAIMRLDPKQPYPGASFLPETLAFAIRTVGSRRVLIGHPRIEQSQGLVGVLRQIGMDADSARTGRDVFRLATLQPDYEFVLLSDALDGPNVRETVQMLRKDPRASQLPVGLMAREEHLRQAEQFAETDPLALAFPRAHDAQNLAYQAARLQDLGGHRTTSYDLRLDQALAALEHLARLARAPAEYGFYDLHRHQAALESALFTSQLSAKAAPILGWLGSPPAQRALVTCASQTARAVAARQAAAEAFAVAVKGHGLLLSRDEILLQYERYNQSETLDADTQQVLAAVLDAIETPSRKAASEELKPADRPKPQASSPDAAAATGAEKPAPAAAPADKEKEPAPAAAPADKEEEPAPAAAPAAEEVPPPAAPGC